MNIFYGFLTVLMFLDCVILVLLVLLQLPKKEAGAGMAFGAGATDALFGAGSGNVLTKITKYAAGIFFGLAIIMAMIASHQRQASGAAELQEQLSKRPLTPIGSAPSTAPSSSPLGGSGLLQLSNLPPAQTTTAPSATPTNSASTTNK